MWHIVSIFFFPTDICVFQILNCFSIIYRFVNLILLLFQLKYRLKERKLSVKLNAVLSVKEAAKRHLLICRKTYRKETKETCLVNFLPMVVAPKEECLESVQLIRWRIGPFSTRKRNSTLC